MFSYSRAAIAGVTFAVAGGTGYYLQRPATVEPVSAPAEILVSANVPNDVLVAPEGEPASNVEMGVAMANDTGINVQDVAALSAASGEGHMPETPDALEQNVRVAALGDGTGSGAVTLAVSNLPVDTDTSLRAPAKAQPADPGCEIILEAEVEDAAMVHLYLDAPCRKAERVTIQHEAMAFTAMTNAEGLLDISVPALSETGIFYAFFGDSEGAMTDIAVPSVGMYERVALMWKGDSGLQVHAREFGADYGHSGHVWADAPRTSAHAVQARGGFLTQLGNAGALQPQMAEVYTFPTGNIRESGTIRLSVEAEITAANCGREIEAVSLQGGGGIPTESVELSLAVPGCQTIGDFLVLNSLLRDLKVASN